MTELNRRHEWSDAATRDDIIACFRLILGREPHNEEIPGHMGFVGQPLDVVVRNYLQSLEFRNRGLLTPNETIELVQLERFSVYVEKDDPMIAAPIKSAAGYEPEVAEEVTAYARPAMIDIGANCGYFSLLACSLGATVYAFEPFARNVRMLMGSRVRNNFSDRLHVIAAAASSLPGTLAIGASWTDAIVGQVADKIETVLASDYVPCVRVDDCIPKDVQVGMIKIDVEGHEYLALMGAIDTIRRCRPVIASEFSPTGLEANSGCTAHEYLQFLRSAGYRHFRVAGQPELLSEADLLGKCANTDHIDIVATATP